MYPKFPSGTGTCLPGAPYSNEFDYHERVFVVAESDDTYVYHLHLGDLDTIAHKERTKSMNALFY